MSVVECDVPSESALGKTLIERADFSDAYRAPLRRHEAGVVELFFAIFAHLLIPLDVAHHSGMISPTVPI